ncbi:hypothetical protein FRB90_004560, partial [Tulasnella sp. 427]
VIFAEPEGLPGLLARRTTYPPPAHPAIQRTLTSTDITHISSWTDDTLSRDPTTTLPPDLDLDLFPRLGEYGFLQDWLESDSILSPTVSPILRTTPPPQLTFPELELVEPGSDDEEATLATDAGATHELEGATDGVEMDDEDVDAEGSTEDDDDDEMDLVSDFEVEVVSPVEETGRTVVLEPERVDTDIGNVVAVEGPTSSEVCSVENDKADHLSNTEAPTTPAPAPPSPTQDSAPDTDALTAETVAALENAAVPPITSIDGSSVSSLTMSQDGSSLSSADGYGETDDDDNDVDHDTTIDNASSFAPSRSSSPASSVEIPLSNSRAGLLESTSPPRSSFSPAPSPAPRLSSPALVAPSKSITRGRVRGPYQRSRPLVQPMDGIPAGAAWFVEDKGTYTCACHRRTYRRKGDLQRHLNEGRLPEVCDGCGRGFPRKDPRIRHWNQNQLCEAIHHVKNVQDPKEAARWKKRWTSPVFRGRAGEMECLVREQTDLLAGGALLGGRSEQTAPPSPVFHLQPIRKPPHRKGSKRVPDSDAETSSESDSDDLDYEEQPSPLSSRRVKSGDCARGPGSKASVSRDT